MIECEWMISGNQLRMLYDVSLSSLFSQFTTEIFLHGAYLVIFRNGSYWHELQETTFFWFFPFQRGPYTNHNPEVALLLLYWISSCELTGRSSITYSRLSALFRIWNDTRSIWITIVLTKLDKLLLLHLLLQLYLLLVSVDLWRGQKLSPWSSTFHLLLL